MFLSSTYLCLSSVVGTLISSCFRLPLHHSNASVLHVMAPVGFHYSSNNSFSVEFTQCVNILLHFDAAKY